MPPSATLQAENQLREFLAMLGRRRAWWMTPTAAGIVVGVALVALVPRKFVARTVIEVLPSLEEELGGRVPQTSVDQQLPLLDAEIRGKELLEGVLRDDVPTPEYAILPLDGQRAYLEKFRSRVEVNLLPTKVPGGEIVNLTYRDLDANRAADVVNAVANRWMDGVKERKRHLILGQLTYWNGQRDERAAEEERALDAIKRLQQSFGLDPNRLQQRGILPGEDPVYADLDTASRRLSDNRTALLTARARLEAAIQIRDELPERIAGKSAPGAPADPAVARAVADLNAQIVEIDAELDRLTPLNSKWKRWTAAKKRLENYRDDLLEAGADSQPVLPSDRNPEWMTQDAIVRQYRSDVAGLEREKEILEERVAELEELSSARPDIYKSLAKLVSDKDTKTKLLEEAVLHVKNLRATLDQVDRAEYFRVPYAAVPPTTPSEPDAIALFAIALLVGAGAGLGLASVREYARTSYRTFEDAARSLPVPILGAVAWVRTEVERRRAKRRRFVAAFATSTATVLLTALFVTYSVRRETLPRPVLDVLDTIRRSLR